MISLIASLVGGLIVLGLLVFWVWMMFHALTNKGISSNEKLGWLLVVFFLSFIGATFYFFVGKPKGA